jgi:hypothetical protein
VDLGVQEGRQMGLPKAPFPGVALCVIYGRILLPETAFIVTCTIHRQYPMPPAEDQLKYHDFLHLSVWSTL